MMMAPLKRPLMEPKPTAIATVPKLLFSTPYQQSGQNTGNIEKWKTKWKRVTKLALTLAHHEG